MNTRPDDRGEFVMGQCVSSSSADSATDNDAVQAGPRCQAPGCQRTCDPTSKSQYCTQHALCRRRGCGRPRYRRGPYCQEHLHTCRVSKCSNDQAKVIDAWFTNNSCLEHQPEDVLRAYSYGDAAEPEAASAAHVNGHHHQRARRRRSRHKSDPIPPPDPEPRNNSDGPESESDNEDAGTTTCHRLSTILSTIGEEAAGDDSQRPSIMKLAEEQTDDVPATPRRSQKTVHFADSPSRPSSPEKGPLVAEVCSAEPANQSSPRLRTSRHRPSLDGRRQSPRTSSSAVTTTAGRNREKRYHHAGSGGKGSNSAPKTADVRRTTRTRPNR